MNLNYDKIKAKHEHGGNQWTSYSDLFLVLSVVFLLLYVVANLRSGTTSFASHAQMQSMKAEVEDLRKQIKAYEVLREDYLQKGASQDEVKVYQELMGQLTLLENDAKDERKALYKQAQEAQEKEKALNQYQSLVKNIISANLVAQSRVKKREEVIEEKSQEIVENKQVIAQKEKDITDLNRNVSEKQAAIDENNRRIADIHDRLEKKIKETKAAWRSKYKSEKAMQAAIAKMRDESEERIASLKGENNKVAGELHSARAEIATKDREARKLLTALQETETQKQAAIGNLRRAHEESIARERAAFESGIARERLSAEAKLAKEREYRESVERKNATYNQKLGTLNDELSKARSEIAAVEGKFKGTLAQVEGEFKKQIGEIQAQKAGLSRELAGAQAKLNSQKLLASRIRQNFAKAGIHAEVDGKTGDVMIQFKDEYFDTGRADLKNGMKHTLEKMMPVYAKSLLQDPKVAERIGSVEIVGFASPTYKGKYVDPDSLSTEDREAVNFNMDLSYQRAKSIFEYVFDPNKMTFGHQKQLLPMVKVSGRSYLSTERIQGRDLSSVKNGGYCSVYDCKKSQRVIIKFNLRDE